MLKVSRPIIIDVPMQTGAISGWIQPDCCIQPDCRQSMPCSVLSFSCCQPRWQEQRAARQLQEAWQQQWGSTFNFELLKSWGNSLDWLWTASLTSQVLQQGVWVSDKRVIQVQSLRYQWLEVVCCLTFHSMHLGSLNCELHVAACVHTSCITAWAGPSQEPSHWQWQPFTLEHPRILGKLQLDIICYKPFYYTCQMNHICQCLLDCHHNSNSELIAATSK